MCSEASSEIGTILGCLDVKVKQLKSGLLSDYSGSKESEEKIAVALLSLRRVEDYIKEEMDKITGGLSS